MPVRILEVDRALRAVVFLVEVDRMGAQPFLPMLQLCEGFRGDCGMAEIAGKVVGARALRAAQRAEHDRASAFEAEYHHEPGPTSPVIARERIDQWQAEDLCIEAHRGGGIEC